MARKKASAPRYRRLRTDRRHHPKLEGLSLLARDIWEMAIDASPLGVLEASLQKIASECGRLVPGGREPTRREVQAAIAELEQRRDCVRWWSSLEVVWVIEAADEQVMNEAMWAGLRETWARLPAPVRIAIAQRYPHFDTVGADSGGGQSPPTVTPHPSVQDQRAGSGAENRRQEQSAPPPVPTREALAEQRAADVARLRERLTLSGEVPKPIANGQKLGNLPVRPDDLGKLLDAGLEPDEIIANAAWLSGEISAGRALRGAWTSAVFYGRWHDSLHQREIPEKFRPNVTKGPVNPRTQDHSQDHDF